MYYLKIAGLELIIFYIQREFVKILRSPKVFFFTRERFQSIKIFWSSFFLLASFINYFDQRTRK